MLVSASKSVGRHLPFQYMSLAARPWGAAQSAAGARTCGNGWFMFDVIVVGCGPTGGMLAAELRLHDVRVLVVEREPEPVSSFVRIVGLHIRSLELMAMRGLLDRFLESGRRRPVGGIFAAITKPAPEGLDSAYAYLLGIPQPVVERLLEERAIELGAQVRRGCAVTAVEQDEEGVSVELAGG